MTTMTSNKSNGSTTASSTTASSTNSNKSTNNISNETVMHSLSKCRRAIIIWIGFVGCCLPTILFNQAFLWNTFNNHYYCISFEPPFNEKLSKMAYEFTGEKHKLEPPHRVILPRQQQLQQQQYVPDDDPIFGGYPIVSTPFEELRKDYSTSKASQEPFLQVAELPINFRGEHQIPQSITAMKQWARQIFDSYLTEPKTSNYAIVSICIGIDLCTVSPRNHRHYAKMHGYDYLLLDETLGVDLNPKMLKYLLLTWAMDRGYDWCLMMDADALFTNVQVSLPTLIHTKLKPSNSTSLIVTRGGNWKNIHAINNGIFILRRSTWSFQHCFDIFTSRYAYTRPLGKTLIDQPIQVSILIAKKDIMWPPVSEKEQNDNVLIVEKRAMNSFRRDDTYRNSDDLEGGSWTRGDFIAHFASGQKYTLMVDLMEEEGMENNLPPIDQRFSFPLPAPGQDSSAGRCWCEVLQNGDSATESVSEVGHGTSTENNMSPALAKHDGTSQLKHRLMCLPSYHVIGVHKAGTKSLVNYLASNPGLISTGRIEDPARWLTEASLKSQETACSKLQRENKLGIILASPTGRRVSTCSLDGYAEYDALAATVSSNATTKSKLPSPQHEPIHAKHTERACRAATQNGDAPVFESPPKPIFDEMVIWDHTFHKARGIYLPELMHRLQPNANLLVSIREPIDVTYSAYNHFGAFGEDVTKSPQHFDRYIRKLIGEWNGRGCTPANYRRCLPPSMIKSGSWISRAMYSSHLTAWLSHFQCHQMHLFDTSQDPLQEVERLYDYVGFPNREVAVNATSVIYQLQQSTVKGRSNAMNKAGNEPLLDETKDFLADFFQPYQEELCGMMEEYPCLNIPVFKKHCIRVDA